MNLRKRRDVTKFVLLVQHALTDDLLKPEYRGRGLHAGHCYVASQALFHMLGGKHAGWTPQVVRHEGSTHWYLKGPDGRILDATAAQFNTPPDYSKGRGCGFLTREPDKRTRILLARVRL